MSEVSNAVPPLAWPAEGLTRVPLRVYQDDAVFDREQERIFRGATWNFLCLESEVAAPGDYRTTMLGTMPVAVVRDRDGAVRAFENRCAHRGSLLFHREKGNLPRNVVCVYHNWTYDLAGNLRTVAFKDGVRGEGGMPREFTVEGRGPRKLRVQVLCGIVFGTLSDSVPALEDYLSPEITARIRRVLTRAPVVLGRYTQVLHNNWKLYVENVKDSYHASLLHVFFATFRITRLTQAGGIVVDPGGGNHASFTLNDRGAADPHYREGEIRSNKEDEFSLHDKSMLEVRDETHDDCHIQILSVFPGFALQAHMNSIAVRHVVPVSPTETHLRWTFLGFADDDEALRTLRMKHANLVGPAGYVSMEDGAVGGFVQRGIAAAGHESAIVEMGGAGTASSQARATEASVRGFWKAYRALMEA